MLDRRNFVLVISGFLATAGFSRAAFANQASVKIEAPDHAAEGDELTIKIHVFHRGNSFSHYVEWVYIAINGKEEKRWEYSSRHRPEKENFTLEYKVKVKGPVNLKAEASCNIHGSKGPSEHQVKIK